MTLGLSVKNGSGVSSPMLKTGSLPPSAIGLIITLMSSDEIPNAIY